MRHTPAHRIPSRRRRNGRQLVTLGLALLVTAAVTAVSGALSVPGRTQAGAASPAVCPTGTSDGSNGCIIKLPCQATYVGCSPSAPPTVDIGPVTNLEDGQYVTVTATNFPTSFTDGQTTGSMQIALCSTGSGSSAANPWCLNGTWEAQAYAPAKATTSTATADHVSRLSYPVFYDPRSNGTPIPAQQINPPQGPPKPGSFYCDGVADTCAIEVTILEGQGNFTVPTDDTAANTFVAPVAFNPPVSACPSSDTVLNSTSSSSVENLIPAAVGATCASSTGVIDFNTGKDNLSAISDFASKSVNLAFVDNPADPTQEAQLLGGQGFAYIPIAVSATEVGFLATANKQTTSIPVGTYDLTPTMLAGIITTAYSTPQGVYSGGSQLTKGGVFQSDNLLQSLTNALGTGSITTTCDQLVICQPPAGTKKVSKQQQLLDMEQVNAFDLLNPAPAGWVGPETIGSFMSDVPVGASYQATSWICQQSNAPLSVGVQRVGQSTPAPVSLTDTNAPSSVLTGYPYGSTSYTGNPSIPWVYPTCSSYSQLPVLNSSGNQEYGQFSTPSLQARNLRIAAFGKDGNGLPNLAPPTALAIPTAAFGAMDSSEANYFGLNAAALQNDAGNFETPTPTTVGDALTNEVLCTTASLTCPKDTYTFDYSASSQGNKSYAADAYPMPDITYAVVPTGAQPADTAKALKDFLTNLVDFSHQEVSKLPDGYYPMPSSMYQAALADIAADVTSQPTPPTTTTPTTTPPSTTPTTSPGTSPSSPDNSGGGGGFNALSGVDTPTSYGSLPLTGTNAVDTSSTSGGSGSQGSPNAAGEGGGGLPVARAGGFQLLGLDTPSRLLFPVLVVLALACLVGGPLLMFGPDLRRRRRRGEGS